MSAAHEPNPGTELNRLLGEFGLHGDDWLDGLRAARRGRTLERLGAYELLEEIGRGGQGVVYRAWQKGTQRYVALKHLVLGDLASESMRGRFEREIQAAASLDHPHIVTIHGVERVEDRPFLLMEWINGAPINRWVEEHLPDRDPRTIVRLVIDICEAVHHAHQRGVLHRDLKPSNILVDDRGKPHLLDFGLAKHLSDPTNETLSGEFVGTPAYAAPEQLSSSRSADVRADVYSIGVMLFELLTGAMPFDAEPGLLSWLRALERDEPRPPSALRLDLSRELDILVLHALEKDPERRYSSADALREDLQRFLDGRPILAHPPSTLYQLGKLIRRNVWPFVLAASVLILLVAFAVHTSFQNEALRNQIARVRRAERLASDRLEEVEKAKEQALAASDEARSVASRSDAVLRFFLDDVLGVANPFSESWSPTLIQAVERAEGRLEDSELDSETRAAVHQALSRIFRGLGRYEPAESHLSEALAAEPDASAPSALALRVELALTWIGQHRFEEAAIELETILGLYDSRSDVTLEQRVHALQTLGEARFEQSRIPEAGALFESALELAGEAGVTEQRRMMISADLALVLREQGERERAIASLEQSIARARERGAERSETFTQLLFNLGQLQIDEVRLEEAVASFREAMALREEVLGADHPSTAHVRSWLAKAIGSLPDPAEALPHAEAGLKVLERELDDDPRLAEAHWILAEILQALARYDAAEEEYAKGMAIQRALFGESSVRVASGLTSLGSLYLEMGRFEDAERSHQEALALYEAIPGSELRAASSLLMLGRLHLMQRDDAGARPLLERAAALYLERKPADEALLGFVLDDLAGVAQRLGDRVAALEHARGAVEIEARRQDFPPQVLARRRVTLARLLIEAGEPEDGLETARLAFEYFETEPEASLDRAACELLIYQVMIYRERFEEAEQPLLDLHARLATNVGADHAASRAVQAHLVRLFEAWRKPDEARRWRER